MKNQEMRNEKSGYVFQLEQSLTGIFYCSFLDYSFFIP